MTIAGLILCGGASRRMGRAKALLEYEGETFVGRLMRLMSAATDETIVVLGHEPERVREAVKAPPRVRFVVNHRYEEGQLSSLQTGLREAAHADAAMFLPVDYPAVRERTFSVLAGALRTGGDYQLVVPRFDGHRGHPVGCRAAVAAEILALPAGASARDVVRAHRDETLYIDVDDAGIVEDVDDPAAYARLLGGEARQ